MVVGAAKQLPHGGAHGGAHGGGTRGGGRFKMPSPAALDVLQHGGSVVRSLYRSVLDDLDAEEPTAYQQQLYGVRAGLVSSLPSLPSLPSLAGNSGAGGGRGGRGPGGYSSMGGGGGKVGDIRGKGSSVSMTDLHFPTTSSPGPAPSAAAGSGAIMHRTQRAGAKQVPRQSRRNPRPGARGRP